MVREGNLVLIRHAELVSVSIYLFGKIQLVQSVAWTLKQVQGDV